MTAATAQARRSRAAAPRPHLADADLPVGDTAAELMRRYPPRPVSLVWPSTQQRREQVAARLLAPPFTLANYGSQRCRRDGLVTALNWLQDQPGQTWQQRWVAAQSEPADGRPSARRPGWNGEGGSTRRVQMFGTGLLLLIGGDVIRPDICWLLTRPPAPQNLPAEIARVRDPAGFAALIKKCADDAAVSEHATSVALKQIAVILAAKGGTIADITIGDCVQLLSV